jgi:hypothetical protein
MAVKKRTYRLPSMIIGGLWLITVAGGWNVIARAVASTLSSGHTSRAESADTLLLAEVVLSNDELGLPTHIVVDGDELLLVDRYRQEAVFSVDRHSREVIRSFGGKGEGPGEFKGPTSLVVSESGVAVLDASLNRITRLASGPQSAGFSLLGTTQLRVQSAATDLSVTSDGQFIVAGFLGSRRLAYVSREGEFLAYVGEPPTLKGLPPKRRSEVFQGSLRSSPGGHRHVVTGRFSSRIEVIDERTEETKVIWGPIKFEPHAGRYETRFGYLDSAPMADGFLALYSGRTRGEFPGRANYGTFVHEFTWEGALRAIHKLDADVITIAWSEPDRKLYAVRHDPLPAILVYSLPP